MPDALDLPRHLSLDQPQRARLARLFDDLLEVIPSLYAALPQQIIHGDFALGNTLMEGGRVTGILDFEFASPDLRAMDLTAGLCLAASGTWDSGAEWAIMRAFGAGYGEQCSLTPAEVAALPTLLRLHRAAGLIHWVGRHRQGLAREEVLPRRVAEMIALDDWLAVHDRELVARLSASLAGDRA